jgi:hypothetical protein
MKTKKTRKKGKVKKSYCVDVLAGCYFGGLGVSCSLKALEFFYLKKKFEVFSTVKF